jgi:ubiquinone/menaquinone biosynthesis C-methylase UbiE
MRSSRRDHARRPFKARSLRVFAALLMATLMLPRTAEAGPPGVPRLDARPTSATNATAPDSAAPTDEDVLILDRRRYPAALLDLVQAAPAPAHLVVLDDWIVAADRPERLATLRTTLAEALMPLMSSWSIEARIVELDPSLPETAATLNELRADPSGEIAESIFHARHPGVRRMLASPRVLARTGEPATVRIEDDGSSIEWSVVAKPSANDLVSLGVDLEVARERTLGRRIDRLGARAVDRQREVAPGRPLAITTAAFANTTVRELDGGRLTVPRAVDDDQPPVVIVLSAVPSREVPGLPEEIYRTGEASRDGTGRFHFDREIAQVMGHLGAGWLERPEREREERTEHLLAMLGIDSGSTVADIGAGSGYFTRRLARLVGPDGRVLATDIQPEMLEILDRGLVAEGIENVDMILGRVDDTGLESSSVDLILLVDVYHEFDHPWEMARSMRRALRPGGRVALVEYRANDPAVPIKPLHTMTAAQSRLEFEAAGFRLVEEREDGLPWQRLQLFEAARVAPE